MKKLIPLLLIALMVVILGSCGGNKEPIVLHDAEDGAPDVTEEVAVPEMSDIDSGGPHTETAPEQNDDLMSEEFAMPPPFGYSDGDMNVDFWEPCNMMFGGVPGSLMSLRAGVSEWIDSFPKISSYAPSDIFEYPTIYSFIAHFNITNEEAKEALGSYVDDGAISPEQLDMICSGDVEQMTREFASEYAIVIGEKIYCPHWLYIHSFEEYKAAGITADMILEKAPLFSHFTFTDEARAAFSDKLSSYTDETIVIEPREG